ncbi:hypothetical protein GW915_11315 [bacterium]|nr:hypothetical protein [bacterium]
MIESYYLEKNAAKVGNSWELKKVLALEIFKRPALRMLQPDLIKARTRVDLMLLGGQLGIRGKSLEDGDFEFFPVTAPDSSSPELISVMEEFLQSKPVVEMAQVRFRCSPDGLIGIWLDCSHQATEEMMTEKRWVKSLLDLGWIVEFGQKAQHITLDNNTLSIKPTQSHCWLPSFDINNQAIALKSNVASFSQPGLEANRALIACLCDLVDEHSIKPNSWVEYGAGYGNLTAALHSLFPSAKGWASESDPTATQLLKNNAQEFFPKVAVEQVSARVWDKQAELLVIDPPRSGFSELLKSVLESELKPKWILAVHCHYRGITSDVPLLQNSPYDLLDWSCADIFPATPHMEHISLWKLSS